MGACCDALIAAGVKRVVWACPDPNPTNRGRAARVLRRAGIDTACWAQERSGARRTLARDIWATTLRPFAKHVTTGLPYVTVKLALSLDGRICDTMGQARWISGPASLRETATWRERADVVLVGAYGVEQRPERLPACLQRQRGIAAEVLPLPLDDACDLLFVHVSLLT